MRTELGTAGWTQEISTDEFIAQVRKREAEGASATKAIVDVMLHHNVSMDDLKNSFSTWSFICH